MKSIFTSSCAAAIGAGLFAIPLSQLVTKESEKIAGTIKVYNKDCAGVTQGSGDQQLFKKCYAQHAAIAEALVKFVVLANQELDFLPENYKSDPPDPQFDKQTADVRKDMQLQVRWALYDIRCLGRESASECKVEKAALEAENYPFGRAGLAAP